MAIFNMKQSFRWEVSRGIGIQRFTIAWKFVWSLGSNAADQPVIFQSDTAI